MTDAAWQPKSIQGDTVGVRIDKGAVPSLREAQARMTRDRIVEAAFTAFSEKGYQATSATEIASAAGASRATFYLHFATKAEIILDVIERNESELFERYRDFAVRCSGSESEICLWLKASIERWKDQGLHYQAMEQAVATEPKVAKRWIDSISAAAAIVTHEISPDAQETFGHNHHTVLALMIQFERVMFFSVVGNLLDVDTFCQVLAAQWWSALGKMRS